MLPGSGSGEVTGIFDDHRDTRHVCALARYLMSLPGNACVPVAARAEGKLDPFPWPTPPEIPVESRFWHYRLSCIDQLCRKVAGLDLWCAESDSDHRRKALRFPSNKIEYEMTVSVHDQNGGINGCTRADK
jgi:hypothetical protein